MDRIVKLAALMATAALCLAAAAPAAEAGGPITAQQKAASEKFIKALMQGDYKAAYQQFSPQVRDRYPFPVFTDIQNNMKISIGTPVSFALRKQAPGPAACMYDMVFAKEGKKTSIPLQIRFAADDPEGRIQSISFVKEWMQEMKN